jgi:hypothetical protein
MASCLAPAGCRIRNESTANMGEWPKYSRIFVAHSHYAPQIKTNLASLSHLLATTVPPDNLLDSSLSQAQKTVLEG